VAAGYALYGSATMVVLSLEKSGVNGFMYDPVSQPYSLYERPLNNIIDN
jgi:fructose-1,6-bisphosphatase I